MSIYGRAKWVDKNLFGKNYYFLIIMTAIHVLKIIETLGGIDIKTRIFYKMTFTGWDFGSVLFSSHGGGLWGLIYSYLLVLAIFLIDCGFLLVLMFEFEFIRLSYKKILIIEVFLIMISFFIPLFREIMFFMSFNTIVIYLIYRYLIGFELFPIIGPMFKYGFLISAYMMFLKLVIIPIFALWGFFPWAGA